jgi:hypothetical protein
MQFVKWLNQLVAEVRSKEGKRITIVGQAQTQQQSSSEILLGEAAILTPSALPDDTFAVGPKPPQ